MGIAQDSLGGLLLLAALVGCTREAQENTASTESPAEATAFGPAIPSIETNPARNAYFGDLHVHTMLSADAFIFGTRATPDDAYRYAKGEAIHHSAGFEMQLRSPLDFEAVTDHAAYLGMMEQMNDPTTPAGQRPEAEMIRAATTVAARRAAFGSLRGLGADDPVVLRSAWQRVIEAAERHNDPGTFTTFIAYEYSASGDERQNLHRNVIFRGSRVPELPFSRLDSANPEDLWQWMDGLRKQGIESLAVPHNSNGSDGMMFEMTDQAGNPIDRAYAELRIRNEPLVEITQVKGTSDTHPMLSPNDEWADFEIYPYRIGTMVPSTPSGSYVRQAFLRGLEIEARTGANPYRLGVVGASDTHVAAGAFSEFDYMGTSGELNARSDLRGSTPLPDGTYAETYYPFTGASGLTGVWAEANTRDAIYDAFRRRETFATTGPRIQVRLFAGYDLPAEGADVMALYAAGVPMGGELLADGTRSPKFVLWALRDPQGTPLQRLQVIKGWLEGSEPRERVYDVACSDGGRVDPDTHRCPDNGATVDLTDCSISGGVGAAELRAIWQDPDFDPGSAAFYYVRVLENPTCRWSTWDALRADVAPRPDLPATLQERAWSSPIWFRP